MIRMSGRRRLSVRGSTAGRIQGGMREEKTSEGRESALVASRIVKLPPREPERIKRCRRQTARLWRAIIEDDRSGQAPRMCPAVSRGGEVGERWEQRGQNGEL